MKRNYVSPTFTVFKIKSRYRLLDSSDPTESIHNPIDDTPQGGDGD